MKNWQQSTLLPIRLSGLMLVWILLIIAIAFRPLFFAPGGLHGVSEVLLQLAGIGQKGWQ